MTAASGPAARPMDDRLTQLKARSARGDRPLDKPVGRWLGDFLDQETPSGLLPNEERLLRACAGGYMCQAPRPREGATLIRGRFLRFLVLGGDESAPVHEAGVELVGALIDGKLDLRGGKCVSRLSLANCVLMGALEIEDASLGTLFLKDSRVQGIFGDRARITGSVFLSGEFVSEGDVKFMLAEIGGSLQCGGAKFLRAKTPEAQIETAAQTAELICIGAKIKGDVSLNGKFETDGRVWFTNAEIGGNLRCDGAKFLQAKAPEGQTQIAAQTAELICTGAKIKSDVFLNGTFKTDGRVWLANTEIGGNLLCNGAKFRQDKTPEGQTETAAQTAQLICTGAKIKGDVLLNNEFEIKGDVWFDSAEIAGSFCCDKASMEGTVSLVNGRVGRTFSSLGCQAKGQVTLYGAEIERDFDFSGSRLSNANGPALLVDTAQIKGNVRLSQNFDSEKKTADECFDAEGGVSLNQTRIGGHLDCTGGQFKALNGTCAISATALSVGGCVFLSGPNLEIHKSIPKLAKFNSRGEVQLLAAQIGLQLNCTNAEFENRLPNKERPEAAGYALNLGGVSVTRELLLGTDDQTDYPPAKIQGSINFSGARIGELADRGLVRESGPDVRYFPATVKPVPGTNSSGKTAKQVDDGLQCEIVLDGFLYERINTNSCLGWKARKGWLERQPKNHRCEHFRHQPFDHLAGVLRAMGLADDARKIAILKQRYLTASIAPSKNPAAFVHWLWRILLSSFFSYGYRPGQGVVIAMVMAVALGWFYEQAEQNGAIVKHKGKEQPALKTGLSAQEGEARFHPYIYSLDVMLPVVKLGEADAWGPSRTAFRLPLPLGLPDALIGADWTQYVIWAETVFGWFAGGMLLAVVSGFIKKD